MKRPWGAVVNDPLSIDFWVWTRASGHVPATGLRLPSVLSTVSGSAFTPNWFLPVTHLAELGTVGTVRQVASGLTGVTLPPRGAVSTSKSGHSSQLAFGANTQPQWLFLCKPQRGHSWAGGRPPASQQLPPQQWPSPQGTLWVVAAPSTTVAHRDPPRPDGAGPARSRVEAEGAKQGAPRALCCSCSPPAAGARQRGERPGRIPSLPFLSACPCQPHLRQPEQGSLGPWAAPTRAGGGACALRQQVAPQMAVGGWFGSFVLPLEDPRMFLARTPRFPCYLDRPLFRRVAQGQLSVAFPLFSPKRGRAAHTTLVSAWRLGWGRPGHAGQCCTINLRPHPR